MSSQNYFDLLGDDENEEPTAVIARATLPSSMEKLASVKKLPSTVSVASHGRSSTKLPPPPEAVKELKSFEGGRTGRGGGRGVRGGGRGGHGDRERESGYPRESRDGVSRERAVYSNDRNFSVSRENSNDGSQGNRASLIGSSGDRGIPSGVAPHGGSHGERGHRGDGENWSQDGGRGRGSRTVGRGRDRGIGTDVDDRLRRREFDRRSGSGFGNEIKRDGSGRGNWGSEGDQTAQQEGQDVSLNEEMEKPAMEGEVKVVGDVIVDDDSVAEDSAPKKEAEGEDNELTLDEYEKILESKRKALLSSKAEERKVQADQAFASMQLVDRKNDESVFIKLGSDKDKKKKEALEKEEKAKKTQSINEFLKPADGEKYYGSGGNRGRGRGRGRESRGGDVRGADVERVSGSGGRGNSSGGSHNPRRASAPRIEDPGQFPNLGAK